MINIIEEKDVGKNREISTKSNGIVNDCVRYLETSTFNVYDIF